MPCRKHSSIILLLAGLIATPLYVPAQIPPSTGPPLVRLNLAALDAHGNPVSDLKSEELQISDAGKPQQIVYFRSNSAERSPGAKLAVRENSSNASNQSGPDPRAIVVLFDLLNENIGNRGYGADELVKAVEKLETPDYVYIYLLTKDGRLFAVRPVPPPNELGRPAVPWTEQLHGTLDGALRTVTQLKSAEMKTDRDYIVATYRALEEMARQVTAFPGRKNIVWITQGVPLVIRDVGNQMVDLSPQLRSLSAVLDRGNVAVVPVVLDLQSGAASLNGRDMLQTLADLTSGPSKIYSDLPGALDQAVQTARASYRIVYDPAAKNWDGKFHKIKITCKRAGVHLQIPQGYLADRAQWTSTAAEQDALETAGASPFDFRAIGLRAAVAPDEAKKDGPSFLQIHVNLADVMLSQAGEPYQGELVMAVTRFYRDHQIAPTIAARSVSLRLSAKERDSFAAEGFPLTDAEPIGSDLERVRVVVFDRGSGFIGALSVALP